MKTASHRCIGLLSCLVLGFAVLLAGGVRQDAVAATWEISPETQAAIDALPPADQDTMKRDIAAVTNSCRPGTVAADYQNCACIVVHFVEERLKDLTSNWGDVEGRAMVAMGATCRDEAAVRAHFTDRCEARHARDHAFVDQSIRTEFCTCYAANITERFMAAPPDVSRVTTNWMVDANLACDSARFLRLTREWRKKQQAE